MLLEMVSPREWKRTECLATDSVYEMHAHLVVGVHI